MYRASAGPWQLAGNRAHGPSGPGARLAGEGRLTCVPMIAALSSAPGSGTGDGPESVIAEAVQEPAEDAALTGQGRGR
jgi:hypothetical protein